MMKKGPRSDRTKEFDNESVGGYVKRVKSKFEVRTTKVVHCVITSQNVWLVEYVGQKVLITK